MTLSSGPTRSNPIKVLIIGPDRGDPGGVANYYNAVLPWVSKERINVEYIEIGSSKGKRNPLHIFTDQFRVLRQINTYNPEIVHLNPSLNPKAFIRDGLFLLLVAFRKRASLVFFRGWQEDFERSINNRFLWFFRATYGRADAFIVLAKRFADQLRDWGIEVPIHLGTTAIPNQLLENFSLQSKIAELNGCGDLRLLYLSRLEPEKGILELLGAFQSLVQRGRALTLTIAGDGSIMKEVQAQVATMGENASRVRVVGYVRGELKAQILREHHLFCFPTHGEGMPNALLEAMGFGLAIVTYPTGGIADFFDERHMGSLIDRGNPESLEQAIDLLIADRPRLVEISRYNHSYARDHFMASKAASFLEDRYRELCAQIGR